VGNTPLIEYVEGVWPLAYGNILPNAAMQFDLPGSTGQDGLYLELSSPTYDPGLDVMTFSAVILNHTLPVRPTNEITFSNVALNVLNNAVDDQEVSSYIQYSAEADLLPTQNPDEYQLVMVDAGPEMFWVDNAPGRYSDKAEMSYFFNQWDHLFGGSPPNAALYGATATQDLKLYFLTLTNPVYDEVMGRVTYTAKILGQTSGPMETLEEVILSIDTASFDRFPMPGKGTGFQPFSRGYDPSTANNTAIYFGSDIARRQMGSLWGTKSYLSQSCEPHCRNDLQTVKDMGVNLIRLYDWDPANDHSQFLNYAHDLGLKVVVAMSNWLPKNPQYWDEQVPWYFNSKNFGNADGTDWHPAVAGVLITNEPLLDIPPGQTGPNWDLYGKAMAMVGRFLQEADKKGFSKNVMVGIPVAFVPRGEPFGPGGADMPGWKQFDLLLNNEKTKQYKDRIFLAANTYNDRNYLFNNAQATGQGWVQLTYKQFQRPILFAEIGQSRRQGSYTNTYVEQQLKGTLEYQKAHPEQLLGACHFQYSDKVWKQDDPTDAEGAFGAYTHGAMLKSIQTVAGDYDGPMPHGASSWGVLHIDKLNQTTTYPQVTNAYK
jgi:hypothetical protein